MSTGETVSSEERNVIIYEIFKCLLILSIRWAKYSQEDLSIGVHPKSKSHMEK